MHAQAWGSAPSVLLTRAVAGGGRLAICCRAVIMTRIKANVLVHPAGLAIVQCSVHGHGGVDEVMSLHVLNRKVLEPVGQHMQEDEYPGG